jgi:hypothetical protein
LGVVDVATKYGTERRPPRELAISELAASQHRVVSHAQLRQFGLRASSIRSRVAIGRLHRVHRGACPVGVPVFSPEGADRGDRWGTRPTARAWPSSATGVAISGWLVAGWQVVRFTWTQVNTATDDVARTVRNLLADRRGGTD